MTRPTVTRLVGYLRVSTNEQVENGLGLDVQRDAIITEAEQRGATVVAWYTDEGESGSNGLTTRVALGEALDAVEFGDAEGVIIYRLDRLARDLVLQEQLLADVWRKHGQVISCSQSEDALLDPDDRSDPSRTLIRQVLGAVAEYERKMIVLRLRSGRRRKIAGGGYGGGPRPFGWAPDGQAGLAPVPDEQATLRLMADLRARGIPFDGIAAELTERELPKSGGGTNWTKKEVHRTLTGAMRRWAGDIPDEYRVHPLYADRIG